MNDQTKQNAGNGTAKADGHAHKQGNGNAGPNKSNQRNNNGSAKPVEQTQSSKPSFSASPFARTDPKQTAQEEVHQVTPKAAIKPSPSAVPANDAINPPPVAARGDDDVMSKQQSQSMPSTDQIKGKWKQQVGAAKIAWGKLTEDELLRLEGHEQKLAGLVQERYAITRDEAEKQVKAFFDKN